MRNEKEQTGVEWLIQKLTNRQNGVFDGFPYLSVDEIYDKAKEMQKEQAQKYAEFCVMCDRENLPLLDFESYILTNGGNK
jgi:acetyl-CoA carboxylase carboxyltransferase component